MAPETKQWKVQGKQNGFDELVFSSGPIPKVGENDVLVKLHAAALNYRDLIIPKVGSCYPLAGLHDSCFESIAKIAPNLRDCTPSPSASPSSPDRMGLVKW
jgi:hypothetical protein